MKLYTALRYPFVSLKEVEGLLIKVNRKLMYKAGTSPNLTGLKPCEIGVKWYIYLKKIVFLALIALMIACKPEMKFNREGWNSSEDFITFENRAAMLDDLLENYPLKGKNRAELEAIFGKMQGEGYEEIDDVMSIKVLQKWRGIDPVYHQYLNLKFNKNGVVDSVYLTEYHQNE